MIFKVVTVLILVQGVFGKERGEKCATPNGEIATCIPVKECQVILEGLATRNSSFVKFAQKSQCGYDGEHLVCCGTSPEIKTSTLSDFSFSVLSNVSVCGLEREDNRIVNGELTDIDEFPWMAALEYRQTPDGFIAGILCSGSIITRRYVLTAAHCIHPLNLELFRVRLGEWRLSTDPDCQEFIANTECADPVKYFGVEDRIPHPEYDRRSKHNDIALVRLSDDIPYTDFIRPICLPSPNLAEPPLQRLMTVAGWGITENGTTSDFKMKVDIPLQSIDTCTNVLRVPLTTNQLCAGGEGQKDSCRGDSGGPLMRAYKDPISEKKQFYQEGVVSWGLDCARPGYPAVYTRVSKYIDWMVDIITKPHETRTDKLNSK